MMTESPTEPTSRWETARRNRQERTAAKRAEKMDTAQDLADRELNDERFDGFRTLYVALRRLVRGMADLPDEVLDERMLARRNRAYRLAYIGLTTVTFVPALALYFAADATLINFDLEPRHLAGLAWLGLGTGMALPSAILAWTEPEV